MAEVIDDTKSFTIALISATPPETVSLEWVRDNYDVSKNRYISSSEVSTAYSDYRNKGTITEAQFNAVNTAYQNHTLLPAWPVVATAKGLIVNVTHPSSGTQNTTAAITCNIRNTGDATGTFLVSLSGGGINVRSSRVTISAGATSSQRSFSARLPTSGSKVVYTLKCIRTV